MDHLGFAKNGAVHKMLAKYGNQSAAEKVIFSDILIKINDRLKEQARILLITSDAMYNLGTRGYSKPKKRIPLERVSQLTISKTSEEFIVHVYSEFDFHYVGAHKQEVCDLLVKLCTEASSKKLTVVHVEATSLHNLAAKTPADSRLRAREEQLNRKLDTAEHDSDDEDRQAVAKGNTTQAENDKGVCLDDFELLKVLGRGTFGKVMMVRKKGDGKIYAMKILKKAFIIAKGQVENTQAERRLLETLTHPFLASLKYAFQSKDKLYLVMDFMSGGELFFHLKQNKRFAEPIAKLMVAEIALALGHLHSLGYVYRDLKPENILMEESGHVCLTDFGLAKALYPNTKTNTFCGTPEYLAPEVIQSKGHDKAVDWWSLGILLYELTVGMPPFYSNNVNDMYNKIQTGVLRFPPFLSEPCRGLIIKLLNRNPERRLGSENDVEDIKAHEFFRGVDWERLLRKDYEPQYKPEVKGTNNFDRVFTDEPVVDTTTANSGGLLNRFKKGGKEEEQSDDRFRGFTYLPGSGPAGGTGSPGAGGVGSTGSPGSPGSPGGIPASPRGDNNSSKRSVGDELDEDLKIDQREEDAELWNLEQQFTSFVGLVYPGRALIRADTLHKRNRKGQWIAYTFHLLTDLLMYSEPQRGGKFKLHRKIFLRDLAIDDDSATDCFVLKSSGKSFLVKTNSPADKKVWMEDITSMIMFQKIKHAKAKPSSEGKDEESESEGEEEWWEKAHERHQAAPVWAPDAVNPTCVLCETKFSILRRRHHCRKCGKVVCGECSSNAAVLEYIDTKKAVRICNVCWKSMHDSGNEKPGAASQAPQSPQGPQASQASQASHHDDDSGAE